MRSSKTLKNRTGWQRAVVVVAVGALLAAVVWSSPSVVWLVAAVAAAAAVVLATLSIGRAADASAGNDQSDAASTESAAAQVRSDAPSEAGHADRDARSVSAFVVSLARRNGGLVDQQLALLDTLEASVEDPELLANYFKLDHLATRMRRNADSLLVLAGVDRPGLRGPQAIDEVVRAGISEVEDYRRIDVLALEDVQVTGLAATTLGHLVAELLDNATAFSPPEARVRIAGNAVSSGYEILVADSGIGISEARIDDLNRKLALPPESGAVGDASIGLTVVAMLAARIGATVRLAGSEHGGTIATVHIPSTVLHDAEHAAPAVSSAHLVTEPGPSYTPSPVRESSAPAMASLVVEASQQPMASPLVESTPFVEAGPVMQLRAADDAGSFTHAAPETTTGSVTQSIAEVAGAVRAGAGGRVAVDGRSRGGRRNRTTHPHRVGSAGPAGHHDGPRAAPRGAERDRWVDGVLAATRPDTRQRVRLTAERAEHGARLAPDRRVDRPPAGRGGPCRPHRFGDVELRTPTWPRTRRTRLDRRDHSERDHSDRAAF